MTTGNPTKPTEGDILPVRVQTGAPDVKSGIRILHLISSIGFFGAENVVLNLCRGLRDLGHDPAIGVFISKRTPKVTLADLAESEGIKVARFKCNGRVDISTVWQIRGYLRREGLHVLHSHNYKANLYSRLAGYRHIARVSTLHNWIATTRRMHLYIALDRAVLRGFEAVVAVSGKVRQSLLEAGVSVGRITVIENGVPLPSSDWQRARRAQRRALGIPEAAFVFGTVGRLSPEKGHIVLVEAAKKIASRFPGAVLLIVGDGMERQGLERAAYGTLSRQQVIFTGVRSDVAELLAAMDVFALPSLDEGHPMALLEAMALGKPVVASAVGGVPDILGDGKIGVTVAPGDAGALAVAIEELATSPALAKELGVRARDTVAAEYSIDRMARRYLGIYERLIRSRSLREAPASLG